MYIKRTEPAQIFRRRSCLGHCKIPLFSPCETVVGTTQVGTKQDQWVKTFNELVLIVGSSTFRSSALQTNEFAFMGL